MFHIHYVDVCRKPGLAIVVAKTEEDARAIFWDSKSSYGIDRIVEVVHMPEGSIYWV